VLLAFATALVAQDFNTPEHQNWCENDLPCKKGGEGEKNEPICGNDGDNNQPRKTFQNMCVYQISQCKKGILGIEAGIGACPTPCTQDSGCEAGFQCIGANHLGVKCNLGDNGCNSRCEPKQEKIDLCAEMVKSGQCPEAMMKCISEETCKDGMCSVSAKCEPKTKPDNCQIMAVQQCVRQDMQMGMRKGPGPNRMDACAIINIHTVCAHRSGCHQAALDWCLHGMPGQRGGAARTMPDDCSIPSCESAGGEVQCNTNGYRDCIKGIVGGNPNGYSDCGNLQKILKECAVPNNCNIMYNCFMFKRNAQTCDLSDPCGKMGAPNGAVDESEIQAGALFRQLEAPKSKATPRVYFIIGTVIGVAALAAVVVAVVIRRRRTPVEAEYARAEEL